MNPRIGGFGSWLEMGTGQNLYSKIKIFFSGLLCASNINHHRDCQVAWWKQGRRFLSVPYVPWQVTWVNMEYGHPTIIRDSL